MGPGVQDLSPQPRPCAGYFGGRYVPHWARGPPPSDAPSGCPRRATGWQMGGSVCEGPRGHRETPVREGKRGARFTVWDPRGRGWASSVSPRASPTAEKGGVGVPSGGAEEENGTPRGTETRGACLADAVTPRDAAAVATPPRRAPRQLQNRARPQTGTNVGPEGW